MSILPAVSSIFFVGLLNCSTATEVKEGFFKDDTGLSQNISLVSQNR